MLWCHAECDFDCLSSTRKTLGCQTLSEDFCCESRNYEKSSKSISQKPSPTDFHPAAAQAYLLLTARKHPYTRPGRGQILRRGPYSLLPGGLSTVTHSHIWSHGDEEGLVQKTELATVSLVPIHHRVSSSAPPCPFAMRPRCAGAEATVSADVG